MTSSSTRKNSLKTLYKHYKESTAYCMNMPKSAEGMC